MEDHLSTSYCTVFGEIVVRLHEKFHSIPIWLMNAITVISGIVSMILPIVTAIRSIVSGGHPQELTVATMALLVLLVIIQFQKT